ncbi:MAG: acyl-CoA dehydrogenase family protein [Candidatus Nealsonbacteria bacterium]|nr:acyl-CoA dehydrogenase family protein [Candidatus Nealsonbacteria bacterium]
MATDYYGINDSLSEDEKNIRDEVQKWVGKNYLPIIKDCFEKDRFPREIIPQLAQLGLLGIKTQGYGCPGASNMVYGLVCQELERGDSGLRSFVSVTNSLVMYPIETFGSEEQKNFWLPKLASGEKIGCFGLTEPDAGSDPASMKTTAKKDGENYILNGTKMWITNGSIADVAIVWAKTQKGIRGFLVEKGMEGFSAVDIKGKMSLRASVTSELILDNVAVPEKNMLPKAEGLKAILMCLNEARYGIAWGALGAAIECYEIALNYTKQRKQFGKPIASFQLVQKSLVEMLTEITKGQLLALQLGRLEDEGKERHQQISMAKMNNVYHALKIARDARDLLGANGIHLDHRIVRHMMNLEAVSTYEGTHNIHLLIIGKDITGISAFGNE